MEASYCCKMREYFLIGIVTCRTDLPQPLDIADFVVAWEPKIVLKIKFCPFCGQVIGESEERRIKY